MVEASKALKGEVRPRVGGADAVAAAAPDNKATGGRANDRSDLVAGDDFVIGVVNVGVVPTGGVASPIVGDVVALDVVEAVAIGHDARPRVAGAVVVRHAAPPAGLDPSVRVAVGRAAADRGAAGTDPVRVVEVGRAAANRAANEDTDPVGGVEIGCAAADHAALAGADPSPVAVRRAVADRATKGGIEANVGVASRRAVAKRAGDGKNPAIAVAFGCAIDHHAAVVTAQAVARVGSEPQVLILPTVRVSDTYAVSAPVAHRPVAHREVADRDAGHHAGQGAGYADQRVARQVNGHVARRHANTVAPGNARQRTG